ncbi:hypothetical protein N865_20005 [Intrasporangium oryzae NRRL B-24470]|uniref:Uncharacterized protein n=1 Tax=Intrasporangium oryzae NRRL B-24470 TaxID=1386089 RepID=W9G1C1_9MICO|nr:hypothetical protein [Intrasporangium oryzae]EWS99890.1 hypothetical protein N865_20005 [Intrasporangium oryzae NRRL B-24470]
MSTAATDRGLYAVPAPPRQERLALLLQLRRIARHALDTLLALPRGAAGWVLRRTQRLLALAGTSPALARIGARLRSLGQLIGELVGSVGPIPAAAAVLSIPTVWEATVRAARWLTSRATAGARALWRHTRSLLDRLGPAGTRTARGLASAGTAAHRLATAVATHPLTQTILQGATRLAALIRPASQSTVVHRLLGRLLGTSTIRWAVELLVLPLLLAPSLIPQVTAGLHPTRPTAESPTGAAQHAASASAPQAQARTLAANLTAVPTEPEQAEEPTSLEADTTAFEPRNRAERRAQQQAQAHAKRARR